MRKVHSSIDLCDLPLLRSGQLPPPVAIFVPVRASGAS